MNTDIVKVKNQAELDAALAAKAEQIDIRGKWNNVVIPEGAKLKRVDVYGTVEGSVYVYGTVEGSVDVYGTVEGSVDVYGTVEGSVDVYGTVEGSVDVYGTVEGSVYVSGTVEGSVYVYGTVEGSVYVYGTVEGSVDVYGTVEGSVDVYATAKVGSVYVYGTVEGSVDVYATAKVGSVDVYATAKVGSVDVYGTVEGSVYVSGKIYSSNPLEATKADHAAILAMATVDEIQELRKALVAGKIDGHMYEGECACLVGTLEKGRKDKTMPHDQSRLSEKWYMPISKGHTPENNTYAKQAVAWIDEYLSGLKS